ATLGDGETETAPPQEASVRRRTVRGRRLVSASGAPLSCEGVDAESGDLQATRVEAFAFHGGATLPESHRLRWKTRVFSCSRGSLCRHVLLREAGVVRKV